MSTVEKTTTTTKFYPKTIYTNGKDSNAVFTAFQQVLDKDDRIKCDDFMTLFTYAMAIYSREIFNQPPKFLNETKKRMPLNGHRNHIRILEAIDSGANFNIIAVRERLTKYRQEYRRNNNIIESKEEQRKFVAFLDEGIHELVFNILEPVYIKSAEVLEIMRKYETHKKVTKKSKYLNYDAFNELQHSSSSESNCSSTSTSTST